MLGGFLAILLLGATTHSAPISTPQGVAGACVRLKEASGNGTNQGSICVSDAITTDFTCTLTVSGLSCS